MKNVVSFEQKIINSSNYKNLFRNNENTQDVLRKLEKYLQEYYNYDETKKYYKLDIVKKCILFIKQICVNENIDTIKVINSVNNIKEMFIKDIKSVEKPRRSSNKTVTVFKTLVNELDKVEVICENGVKNNDEITNNNLVKYILFKEKNLNVSINFIQNYPHLINLYSIEDANILDICIDKYLNLFTKDRDECDKRNDLIYFENIIRTLLSTYKIKIDSSKIESNIAKLLKRTDNANINEEKFYFTTLINILDHPKNYTPKMKEIAQKYKINLINPVCRGINYKLMPKNDLEFLGNVYKNRDYIDNYTFTIDGDNTLVRDDAISFDKIDNDKYCLMVHIAEINDILKNNLPIFADAMKRSTTLYLKDRIINMLPKELTKYLSLDEKKYRLARSYIFTFNSQGKILEFNIKKTIIKIDDNFNYDEVNQMLSNESNSFKDYKLQQLNTLLVLAKERNNIGFLSFDDIELLLSNINPGKSMKMVETCMMLTNKEVAKIFNENNEIYLYRNFIKSDLKRKMSIDSDFVVDNQSLFYDSVMKKLNCISNGAIFDISCKGHLALNGEPYGYITSPLRRGADIIANDCVDYCFFDSSLGNGRQKEFVQAQSNYLNVRNKEVGEFYKNYMLIKNKNIKNK